MNQQALHWERHTLSQKLTRFGLYITLVLALIYSIQSVEVIPEFLFDAPEQVTDLFARMWPLEWSYFFQGVFAALMETLHIATVGTIFTILLGVPVGLMAANNIVQNPLLNWFAKFILVATRSINSLVWALLFVAIVGPGALAGTLAIAFRSIGFVGKLLAEAVEEADPKPIEALSATGASHWSILLKGYWPQVSPSFWSILLFRWDINVRESAVLGLVGAGGVGMILKAAMELFYWDRVGLILLTIFTVVILAEIFVTKIRQKII